MACCSRAFGPGPRSGPPGAAASWPLAGVTVTLCAGSRPSLLMRAATVAARWAEPSCRPWSTVTPPTRPSAPRGHEGQGRGQGPASPRRRSRRPGPARRRPGHPGLPGPRVADFRYRRARTHFWAEATGWRPGPASWGLANSSLVGRVSGEVHTLLKVAMPSLVHDLADEPGSPRRTASGSSGRCRACGAGSARSGPTSRAGSWNFSLICSTVGTTCGPTASIT